MNHQKTLLTSKGKSLFGGVVLSAILVFIVIAQINSALAQDNPSQVDSPQVFASTGALNFQGELTDNGSGNAIPDGSYNMRFAIYDAATGGNKKWPLSNAYESQTGVAVSGGLFNVQLGTIDPITPGVFAGGGDRYLQIWVCTSAGASCTTYDDLGRLPISSAAYAQNLAAGSSIEGSSNSLLSLYGSDTSGSVLTVNSTATTGNAAAVYGSSAAGSGAGISGSNSANGYGVYGSSAGGAGVYGQSSTIGVFGTSTGDNGRAVSGFATGTGAIGVYGQSAYGYGLFSQGNVGIQGNLITTGTVESTLDGFKFPDGSIQTTAAGQRPGYSYTNLDSDSGGLESATIGIDGLPVVVYQTSATTTDAYLKVAHCNDLACRSIDTSVIQSPSSGGLLNYEFHSASIAIGASGFPIISYTDNQYEDLILAICGNESCSSVITTTVDTSGNQFDASIAVGADGLPIISYESHDNSNQAWRKVAHCNDANCTNPTLTVIDSTVGGSSDFAIGADGSPIISYYSNGTSPNSLVLKVAICNNLACTSATTKDVETFSDTSSAYYQLQSSIAIGVDGMPIIAYTKTTSSGSSIPLWVSHCSTITCTGTTTTTNIGIGPNPSMAIGSDGMPIISYDSGITHCSNITCSSFTTIDNLPNILEPSLVIGVDGLPLVASDAYGFGVMHCSNRFCVPYARP